MFQKIKDKIRKFRWWIASLLIPTAFAAPLLFSEPLGEVRIDKSIQWNQEITEKRDYGALHYQNADGSITAIFAAGLNHKDDNGNFIRTRASLVDKGTHFETEQTKHSVQLSKGFTGQKSLSNKRDTFIWTNPKSENVAGELFYIGDTIDSQPIYGVKYREAYAGVDVVYSGRFDGVQEDYIIKSPTSTHQFEIDIPTGSSQKLVKGGKEFSKGSIGIRNFKVLSDSKLETEPGISFSTNKVTLTVPVETADKYPLILDPSPFDSDADNAGTESGRIVYDPPDAGGTAWATLHNNTGTTDVTVTKNQSTGVNMLVRNMYIGTNGHELISRIGLNWDTDSIGSGATISSSTVKIHQEYSVDDCDPDGEDTIPGTANDTNGIILVDFNPASDSDFVAGDYDAFGVDIAGEDAPQIAPELPREAETLDDIGKFFLIYSTTTYANYINVTGSTTLGVIMRGDQSDINPNTLCSNGAAYYGYSGSANTTEANRPILLVEYTPGAAGDAPIKHPDVIWIESFNWLIQKVYAKPMQTR